MFKKMFSKEKEKKKERVLSLTLDYDLEKNEFVGGAELSRFMRHLIIKTNTEKLAFEEFRKAHKILNEMLEKMNEELQK